MDFVNPSWAFVFVDGWLAPRLFRSFYRRFAQSIELRGSERVLEFGCGSGGISEWLAPRLTDGALTCLDISPPMIRIAEKRLRKYRHVRCVTTPIEDADIEAESLDVIVIHNALHDLPKAERERAAERLASRLKPGGRLCFREPTKPSHGLPPEEYRALLSGAGLIEARSSTGSVFPIGSLFEGVFQRPA